MKIEKLLSRVHALRKSLTTSEIAAVFDRMSTEHLKQLVSDPPPSDDTIKDIFAGVGGLHLLEEGD